MGNRYTGVFIIFDCQERTKVDQFKDIEINEQGLVEDVDVINFFISDSIARYEDNDSSSSEDWFDDEED